MMGNSELSPEVDVNSLNPLLSQNVVDQLLSKYMSTLTVSNKNAKTPSDKFIAALVPQCCSSIRGNECHKCKFGIITFYKFSYTVCRFVHKVIIGLFYRCKS